MTETGTPGGDPGPRLLYIDDDLGLSRLVQKELGRRGYQVTLAHDADSGLAALAGGSFDIVALDHFLPGCEGLDLLPRIKAAPDAPPVVYVTGTHEGKVAVAALTSGADDYVIKDVSEDFTALLRAALDSTLVRDRLRRDKEAAEAEVRAARDRAEALLREVNHRVGNSLQMVSSFITLQSRQLTDPKSLEALQATQARIVAVAQVHRRLYTSHDVEAVELASYFSGLADELGSSLSNRPGAAPIRLDCAELKVGTDKAVSLGVIVAELVTNAMKYAYPDGEVGEIRLRLSSDGRRAELIVEDDGVGLGDGKNKGTGLGRKLIDAMATSLRGKLAYDPAHKGVRAVLAFDI